MSSDIIMSICKFMDENGNCTNTAVKTADGVCPFISDMSWDECCSFEKVEDGEFPESLELAA